MEPHQSALQQSATEASFKPFVHRQWTSNCWIALFFNYVAVGVSLAVSVLCWTAWMAWPVPHYKNKRRWGPPLFLFLCSVHCNLLNNYWSSPERITGHVIPLFLWFGFAITTLEKLSETRFLGFVCVFCCNQSVFIWFYSSVRDLGLFSGWSQWPSPVMKIMWYFERKWLCIVLYLQTLFTNTVQETSLQMYIYLKHAFAVLAYIIFNPGKKIELAWQFEDSFIWNDQAV